MKNLPTVHHGTRLEVLKGAMEPQALFEEHEECLREVSQLLDYCRGEPDSHGGWIREPDTRGQDARALQPG